MYNGLSPLLPRPAERDDPDGTTAWSDEVGLPGEKRLLAWTVVQEDTEGFDIHVLWDTPDLDVAMDAAFLHAQAFFGPNLNGDWYQAYGPISDAVYATMKDQL